MSREPTPPWTTPTRYLALILILVVIGYVMFLGRDILAALIAAALVAYVLSPAVNLLTRLLKGRRKLAVGLIYAVLLALLASTPLLVAPPMLRATSNLTSELTLLEESIEQFFQEFTIFGFSLSSTTMLEDLENALASLLQPELLIGYLQALSTNLAWVLISLVSIYYFLQDYDKLKGWARNLVPVEYRPDASRLYRRIREVWEAYLRGQVALMLFVGVITGLSVAAVGLPGALIIGLLAGLLDIIPSLGPAVAAFVAIVVALFQGSTYLPLSNLLFAVVVGLIFSAIQLAENIWLRPRVMSTRLHLHPALVFISVVGALASAGILTALVIVPVLSTASVLGKYLLRRVLAQDPWAK
jgi:predicted PurR-regulated permease PerM